MVDPVKVLTQYQVAWFQAWLSVTQGFARMAQHLVEEQSRFLCHAAKCQRTHVEIATGAALTDKYGRRAGDIDPERDV